ncbi:MAG: hypothetical protein U1F57_03090 [bacterium]
MKLTTSILLLAVTFVALPSTATAKGKDKCDCGSLKSLQAELRNAMKLQEAFRNQANELRKLGKGASTIALQKFADGDARHGLEAVPGNKGPGQVDYIPSGRDLYDASASANKYTVEELCRMSPSSIAALAAATDGAECPGIAEAIRAHEKTHINFCQKIGFLPYEDMHGADRAMEEVEAYGAQIKALRTAIASLRCGYQASGKVADMVFSGTICDLEKPFTVNGSIIGYKFNFTPSSTNAGTFNVSAAGMSVTAEGGGSYQIEGIDTDKPRIATMGSATGHSPVGSRTGSGKIYIDLTPLSDSSECGGQK